MNLIKPDIVIVHCSATPDFIKADPHFDKFGAEDINKWHIERGFKKIGYHAVIRRTGEIQSGRALELTKGLVEEGAHCHGSNHHSIGVCYIGTKNPTPEQIESFRTLYAMIYSGFAITKHFWYPHNFFNHKKTCPGFNIKAIFDDIPNN